MHEGSRLRIRVLLSDTDAGCMARMPRMRLLLPRMRLLLARMRVLEAQRLLTA